jgi:hypothetical protein
MLNMDVADVKYRCLQKLDGLVSTHPQTFTERFFSCLCWLKKVNQHKQEKNLLIFSFSCSVANVKNLVH